MEYNYITKAEAIAALVAGLTTNLPAVAAPASALTDKFTDASSIPTWVQPQVLKALANNILFWNPLTLVNGKGALNASSNLMRGEAIAMVLECMGRMKDPRITKIGLPVSDWRIPYPYVEPDMTSYWSDYATQALNFGFVPLPPDVEAGKVSYQQFLPATRAEFSGMIAKGFQYTDMAKSVTIGDVSLVTNQFTDVPLSGYWATDHVVRAVTMGFLSGYEDSTFRPENALTKANAIAALVIGLGNLLLGVPAPEEALTTYFSDAAQIPRWIQPHLLKALGNNLVFWKPKSVNGTVGRLGISDTITRGEAIAMVMEAMARIRDPRIGKVVIQTHPLRVPQPYSEPPPILPHWGADYAKRSFWTQLVAMPRTAGFDPKVNVSRAEFAGMIARGFLYTPAAKTPTPDTLTFPDVPTEGYWASEGILRAVTMGFLKALPDGTFQPNGTITRGEAIVAIVDGLGKTLPGFAAPTSALAEKFNDAAQIPASIQPQVLKALGNNILFWDPATVVSGKGTLNVSAVLTRGEAAAMIWETMARIKDPRMKKITLPVTDWKIAYPYSEPAPVIPPVPHWAEAYVKRALWNSLVTGPTGGEFDSKGNATRAEYAVMIGKFFAYTPMAKNAPSTVTFSDVPSSHWAYSAIQKAVGMGFVSGYTDGTFRPDTAIVKSDVIASLTSGLGALLAAPSPEATTLTEKFTDGASISTTLQPFVLKALANGLLFWNSLIFENGKGTLNISGNIARGELVAMLLEAMGQIKDPRMKKIVIPVTDWKVPYAAPEPTATL